MKKLAILSLGIVGNFCFSQHTYIDPITTAALFNYSNTLRKEQDKTRKKIIDVKKAQATVGVAMAEVGRVQEKVYKGLKEVSGTLQNGMQVKDIYEELKWMRKYSDDVIRLTRNKPQYAVFAQQVSKETQENAIKISAQITEIVTSSETNLMTAGDRIDLLRTIYDSVRNLKINILSIKMVLERAERLGFWRSINPFQGYINTDRDIVENIIQQYNRF